MHGRFFLEVTHAVAQLFGHAVAFVYSFVNARGGVNRYVKFFAQMSHGFYVIGMIMRNENAPKALHGYLYFFQCLFYGADSDACVNQYAVFFCA
ncbi:hypothetical protein SDC9_178222 [bioreactor metagenome]|uniref:Uncharacterized protein n=1 Tax=bioreactor metagenome TaxID=1076179 RepID=A0A645GV74_9ZZZZ